MAAKKPNIVVIWGDDIGQSNISADSDGLMGYRTPNIDRIADEGMRFTDFYAEQSCTAGRSSRRRTTRMDPISRVRAAAARSSASAMANASRSRRLVD